MTTDMFDRSGRETPDSGALHATTRTLSEAGIPEWQARRAVDRLASIGMWGQVVTRPAPVRGVDELLEVIARDELDPGEAPVDEMLPYALIDVLVADGAPVGVAERIVMVLAG